LKINEIVCRNVKLIRIFVETNKETMTTQETIKGITYNVVTEHVMTGKMSEQGFYKTMIVLVRPNGHKEFWGMRDVNGNVTLN